MDASASMATPSLCRCVRAREDRISVVIMGFGGKCVCVCVNVHNYYIDVLRDCFSSMVDV